MSKFYVGIDLHTRSIQICVVNEDGKKVAEGSLTNDLFRVLESLSPFEPSDTEVVIESTINWYWLVDGVMENGYTVKLGEIPEGHIYPAHARPQRDLLRRRTGLVRQRASMYSSLRVQLIKHNLNTITLNNLKQLKDEDIDAAPMP